MFLKWVFTNRASLACVSVANPPVAAPGTSFPQLGVTWENSPEREAGPALATVVRVRLGPVLLHHQLQNFCGITQQNGLRPTGRFYSD